MNTTRKTIDYIFLVLKGVAMGAANKVPGVSGGIVAFVAGFYQEFIYSLQRVNKTALALLATGRFASFFRYINGPFLSAITLGMLVSFFSVSKLLDYLIAHYELNVWSVFFGMIIGSVYSISKHFEKWTPQSILFLSIGISIGIGISLLPQSMQNDHLLFVFFCGVVSVSGMTLPGLSGSFILILLGNYVLLLVDSVNALYDTFSDLLNGDFSFIQNPERTRMLLVLAVFTIGSVVGMVGFSHAINQLLKKHKTQTIAIIKGFIIGSLGVVWPWKETIYKLNKNGHILLDHNQNKVIQNYQRFVPEFSTETAIAIVFIILGLSVILALEWFGGKQKKSTFGLIGRNISYSFSKTYFTEKFKKEHNKESVYINFDISKISIFKHLIKNNPTLKGLNVTIPYKESIIPLLDQLSPIATEIGAVNTIQIQNKKLVGHNTDVFGFEKSIEPLLKKQHLSALILGNGGASKAIAYVLKKRKITYQFVTRTPNDNNLNYHSLTENDIKTHLLIINCTPLGTTPNTEECPDIPYSAINEEHLLFDLVYNPSLTLFLKRGSAQGATICNGKKMLIYQAEKAWEIWNHS